MTVLSPQPMTHSTSSTLLLMKRKLQYISDPLQTLSTQGDPLVIESIKNISGGLEKHSDDNIENNENFR